MVRLFVAGSGFGRFLAVSVAAVGCVEEHAGRDGRVDGQDERGGVRERAVADGSPGAGPGKRIRCHGSNDRPSAGLHLLHLLPRPLLLTCHHEGFKRKAVSLSSGF